MGVVETLQLSGPPPPPPTAPALTRADWEKKGGGRRAVSERKRDWDKKGTKRDQFRLFPSSPPLSCPAADSLAPFPSLEHKVFFRPADKRGKTPIRDLFVLFGGLRGN